MKDLDVFKSAFCPVCSTASSDAKPLYRIRYGTNEVLKKLGYEGRIPKVMLVRCPSCLHHFSDQVLASDVLENYYSNDSAFYDPELQDTGAPVNRNPMKTAHIVSLMDKYGSRGNILEIGCGKGILLSDLREKGWSSFGVEPSPFASEYARSKLDLNVVNGYFDNSTFAEVAFDVIVLNDVFEHLSETKDLLRLIYSRLRTGGILIIGTGNILSTNARLSRSTWEYFSSWEHISFFSKASARAMLVRSSFNLIEIKKVCHKDSVFTNVLRLLENVFVRRPLNIILPNAMEKFPSIRNWKFFKGRSSGDTGVLTSHLAFDHMFIVGEKKD